MACIGVSGFMQAKKSAACEYAAGVKLLQQQQINVHGFVQAVNGNCCMHMHMGRGALCIRSKQISLLQKVGMAHSKGTFQYHLSLCFHIVFFLISRLT